MVRALVRILGVITLVYGLFALNVDGTLSALIPVWFSWFAAATPDWLIDPEVTGISGMFCIVLGVVLLAMSRRDWNLF